MGLQVDEGGRNGAPPIVATDNDLFSPGDRFRARMLLGLPLEARIVLVTGPHGAVLAAGARVERLTGVAGPLVVAFSDRRSATTTGSIASFDFDHFAPGRALLLQACDLVLADAYATELDLVEAAASGVPVVHVERDEAAGRAGILPAGAGARPSRSASGAQTLRSLNEDGAVASALSLLDRLPLEALTSGSEALQRQGIGIVLPSGRGERGQDEASTAEWRAVGPVGTKPAILVRADHAGEFVCQLLLRDRWRDEDVLFVNDEAVAGGPVSVGDEDARFLVHLDKGLNRLALDPPERARDWVASVMGVALWPAQRTAADSAPDGLLMMDHGFQDREPTDLASLLLSPFNRAVGRRNLAWLASSFAGRRNVEIRLRNPFAGQHLTVRLGGQVVCEMAARERVADLTVLRWSGRFDRGFNPITIAPRVMGVDGLGRDLAFYLEDIRFFVAMPAATDLVLWDESAGFGGLEAPVPSQELLEPFRWMQADRASIVLERLRAEHVRITLHCRFLGPRQTLVLRLNGQEVATDVVEGMDLRARRPIVMTANLGEGRNEIGLEVDRAGALGRDGRNLYLLLERLEITAISAE